MRITSILLITFAGIALAGIAEPRIGFVLSNDGGLRPVAGVSGAFVVRPASQTGVIQAAFSGRIGLMKRDLSVDVFDETNQTIASLEASPGIAVLGFSTDGRSAAAWLPADSALQVWRDGQWTRVPLDPGLLGGDLISLSLDETNLRALVRHEDGVAYLTIRLFDGAVENAVTVDAVTGPATLLPGGALLYSEPGNLVLREADASEIRVRFDEPVTAFTRMGRDWIQISTAATIWALRFGERPGLFVLPEVEP